jgi:hypothetical protein
MVSLCSAIYDKRNYLAAGIISGKTCPEDPLGGSTPGNDATVGAMSFTTISRA